MIEIIYGPKGFGKTKMIIDKANATKDTDVCVFITDTDRYMYDIKRDVRFVNAKDFDIATELGFLGFVRGLLAGNYDIKKIFIDGASRITSADIKDMGNFYENLEKIAEKANVDFVLTVSMAGEDLPDFIKKFI